MEDIIDIIVTETTNLIEITSQPTDEVIDVNIIDNREDITLNVTPSVVEININSLTGNFGVEWGDITGTLSNQTDLNTALSLKADLVDGKVPSSQLPSYVDDVVEVANYASLPATGEVGKIYITLDTNFIYRWTGSTYVEIKDSSAVWGAITGTLSSQTDLQNALNLKANDNAVVHNTGNETIAGQKTFTGEVISTIQLTSPTIKVQNSGNASLYSLLLTNSSGIRNVYLPDADGTIALTSNLHNPVTLGTANGLSLSTQVLSLGLASSSANGALSSTDWTTFNNKLSTATAAATYVPYAGATGAVNLGAYDLTVNGITVGIGAGNMSSNTAIGASVLASNTNGSNNAALGYFSLNSNTTGGANTAIGSQTLKSNTNGTFNIAVGYGSLFNSVSANYNTAIGNSALYNTTGSSNTAIGDGAGYNITTGIFNTLIGGYFGTSSMSYNVILSDGARNIRFQFDGTNTLLGQSGNVLINTSTNAGYKLDVNGTGRFTGALSGTSASFSGLTVENNQNGSTWVISKNTNSGAGAAAGFLMTNNTGDLGAISLLSSGNSPANGLFIRTLSTNSLILGTNSTANLTIASGGAATFSSSVTAGAGLASGNALVLSNGTNSRQFQLGYSIGAGYNYFQVYDGASFNPLSINGAMFINSTGNVGIGTTVPLYKTTIQTANQTFGLVVTTNANDTETGFYVQPDHTNGIVKLHASGGSDKAFAFLTGNTERMRITSAGNVGIGTTAPSTLLHLSASAYPAIRIQGGATAGGGLQFAANTDTYAELYGEYESANNGMLLFRTRGSGTVSERMRITSGGNVLVNQTSNNGGGALEVTTLSGQTTTAVFNSVTTSAPQIYLRDAGGAGKANIMSNTSIVFKNGSSFAETIKITTAGEIAFNGSTDIGNNYYDKMVMGYYNSNYGWIQTYGGTSLYLNKIGNAVYAGTQRIDNNSDARIKSNIQNIENALETVLSLSGKKFNMLDEDNILRYGFIAQEVQPYLNDFVTESDRKFEKGDIKIENLMTLESSGSAWAALLVEAIKELKAELDTLKK